MEAPDFAAPSLVAASRAHFARTIHLQSPTRVGGYTNRADKQQLLVVRRSGEVLRNVRSDTRPGDEIMVMPEVPVKNLQIVKTIAQILFQIAVFAGVALGL